MLSDCFKSQLHNIVVAWVLPTFCESALQKHHTPGENMPTVQRRGAELAYPSLETDVGTLPSLEFDAATVKVPAVKDDQGAVFPTQVFQGWLPTMRLPWHVPTHDRLGSTAKYPFFLMGANGESSDGQCCQ